MTSGEYKELSIKEFDRAAQKFDNSNLSVYNMCHKDYPDVLEEVCKEPCESLLDAGCGTGAMLQLFCKDCPNKKYVGIDLSEKMIQVARKKKLSNVRFVVGDCENLPFEDNCFDVVTCSMSFHHYPNPEDFFHSLFRVLKPGGRFILRDVASKSNLLMWLMNHVEMPVVNKIFKKGDVHVYTQEDIKKLCCVSGLKLESYEVRKGLRLHCVVRKGK